ncbi:MAG: cell division protein FtsL [Candidatus Rokubacteria bacterium]|nr:cell division protein FtsL [Candidatus Rokubacteria bacterium]
MTHDRRSSRDLDRRHQRPHREPDPRVRRSLLVALVGTVLVVGLGLGLVAIRVREVQLAYRIDALRAERERIEQLVQQLGVEVATLKAPARVETRARQLGLVAPSLEQVRLAREYVPGAPGTAAARLERAEAVVR